jgi:hypothetical protein
LSAAEGDLYTAGTDMVALRSILATGIICAASDSLPEYGVFARSGQVYTTADDSAMVYLPGLSQWTELDLTGQSEPSGSDVPFCAWQDGASVTPDLVVELTGDANGIEVGSSWAAFRRVEYGVFEDGGRQWLGRKVGNATEYEKLTGPLVSGTPGGFELTYFDAAGDTTTTSTDVARVEITIRSESAGLDRGTAQRDSVHVTVQLRG